MSAATSAATREMAYQALQEQGLLQAAGDLGISQQTLLNGVLGREQASRANVRHIDRTGEELDLCDYLIPYIVASDEKSEFATPQIAVDRELLAVLNEAADFIQPFTRGQELLARIEAAIAKAEGRS